MDKALIIFTRNPELGKCKTRLAKSVGDQEALNIYKHLLQHTSNVAKMVDANRYVFYSEDIQQNDLWDNAYFSKALQEGNNLGERMGNAFKMLFEKKYKKIIIVGSDLLDLNAELIRDAFNKLEENQAVIGPAEDGGYYLLGMTRLIEKVFKNKEWGTDTVYNDTVSDLMLDNLSILETLNDIDYLEDLAPYADFNYLFNLESRIKQE
ncbi:TIGR04282 family arsenosugar biosynthesis glycosyltransferase [Winogradskyella maritima]|uniref:TIGR04282 family arsenosugar biosynthesis glycosyltransferase n=1 Tax=Winogradskyella maritima TaxID=1517766 RepID=A0ABV8AFH3_9FLAO|nr:TIGR04282 family arsenosugar biosynthesis glycosyltransferase [Winogradskyella maritima]